MDKQELDGFRKDAENYLRDYPDDHRVKRQLRLLDHIDALERNDIRLRNLITRAIGWVEEVKCISEQAVQEQRSFITELEIAALTQTEENQS